MGSADQEAEKMTRTGWTKTSESQNNGNNMEKHLNKYNTLPMNLPFREDEGTLYKEGA